MDNPWLNLALLLSLGSAGCFGSHGEEPDGGPGGESDAGAPDAPGSDAGLPPLDAGAGCTLTTPSVEELLCPDSVLEGTRVEVHLTLAHRECCAGGETFHEIGTGPSGEVVIESQMRVCECCDVCDCIGPVVSTAVDLGSLPVGRREVRAGGMSCEIEVRPADACEPVPVTEVRMPRAIFEDQDLPISLISRQSLGCGCAPRIGGSVATSLTLEACDCCEACQCIDPGYEAADIRTAPPQGDYSVNVGGAAPSLSVVERGSCRAGALPTGMRIERATNLVHGGPALTWLVVSGEASVCCIEPMYAVETTRTGNDFALDVYNCSPAADCACEPPGPTSFEAWHALGDLAPGSYRVLLGSEPLAFTIE